MAITIISTDYFLPESVYTNDDFFRDFPEAKGKSLEKTGVLERRIAQPHEVSSDLALGAAQKLIAEQNIDLSKIDLLVFCSYDHDYYTPSTACALHGKLDLPESCGAFDLGLGCSGYVYALATINGLLETSSKSNALLLTASTLTKYIHPKDKSNRFIFGDAGSATFISRTDAGKIGPVVFGTEGKGFNKIIVKDGFSRTPYSPLSHIDVADEFGNVSNPASFYMDGLAVFLFSIRKVPPMIEELLFKANCGINDIDLFIFHQANVFLNETLRKKIGIPTEKFVHCMDKFGNTVQATIPIAITESVRNGRLKPGMKVVLAGFGVGMSWGATIVQF